MDAPSPNGGTACVGRWRTPSAPVHVTRATADRDQAREWFERFEGAGLDGVVAKPLDAPYPPDKRTMFKVKHERTADCVVAGFRWHKSGPVVGSLLLGLYTRRARCSTSGCAASFPMARRRELLEELEPLPDGRGGAGHPGRLGGPAGGPGPTVPGAVAGGAGKDLSWVPLRPELVVEVAYDHMEGHRFRHTAQFRRWRPDRDPRVVHVRAAGPTGGYDLASPDLTGPAPGAERPYRHGRLSAGGEVTRGS